MNMMVGTLLSNRYRIDAQLGEGGMGVVYKAHDTLLDRPVAIKTLSPHLLGDEGLKRLLREAQAAAKLTHPNIVGIYDVIDEGETRLIVMEYVEGQTLRELIPLAWPQAVPIADQICAALAYAHAHGVVHRDVKPENVVVTAGGTAKVMDFGLARSEGRSRLTQAGMVVGTVAYMAPEQALSGRSDGRSDLYSLGAVLYETIAGKPPFEAEDPISVISMHVNVPPVSPRFHTPEIPPVLESVILRLLSKDPTERYASAEEVARILKTSVLVESPEELASGTAATSPGPTLLDLMARGRLIDREEELGTLKGALESMLSGRGQVVLVAGEPGIGKTRLAEELLVYARLRGCLAVTGHCYEQEVNIPYLPFSEALRASTRSMPVERVRAAAGPHAAELVKIVPELMHLIPDLTPSPPLQPEQERLRLYEAVIGFVTALAREQPAVLMLDDIHWADAATLALVRHLARSIRADRVLIVGTYRDVEVDPDHPLSAALTEMNRERLYQRVLVRGLPPEQVAAMIQAIFQARGPVSDEFRDLIYQDTEGNPFFVEEVLKHLVEVGALYVENGQWQRKPIQEIDIPQSMREVIGRRLKRVSDTCQRVLSLGAVVGRRFRFEVLEAIGELPEDQLLDALEEAMRAQLVREESDAGEVEYDFAHAVIREVLYDRISLRRRMTLHQRVGESLERQHAGRLENVVEDLAHHFSRAPHGVGLEKAIGYSLDAAGKAMRLFAYEEAVRYLQNAIDLLGEVGDERRLAETHLALGEPYVYLGATQSAVSAYDRALAYYERQDTPADVARVHRLIGGALQRNWEFSQAIPHLERALAGLSSDTHPADVIQTHLDLARANSFMANNDQAVTHASRALALAEGHGSLGQQAEAHVALGLAAHRNSDAIDFALALAHYNKAVTLARASREPGIHYALSRALNNIAVIREEFGEYSDGVRLVNEAMELGRRARDIEQITFFNQHLSMLYIMMGEWREAARCAEENLRMPLPPVRRLASEHRLAWIRGDWETAAIRAHDVREHAIHTHNSQESFVFSGFCARHNLDLERLHEAHEDAVYAAGFLDAVAEYNQWWPFPFVLEALALTGEHQRCEELSTRAEALCRAAGNSHALGYARYGQGVLALQQGRLDDAVVLLGEAHSVVKGALYQALILIALGRALAQRKTPEDIEHAKAVFQESLSLLEQMGDTRKAGLVRAELTALD